MYPYARFALAALSARRAPPLGIFDTHVSQHICWPWDIDPWMELNNGRTLTLYDLGRVGISLRTGLWAMLRRQRWGIVVAGATVRYRRRITAFQRFEMRTRCLGWDDRFIYMEQSMWRGDACSSAVLIRGAVTSKKGIVPPAEALAAMGEAPQSPPLPDWVWGWIDADATRIWPPEA